MMMKSFTRTFGAALLLSSLLIVAKGAAAANPNLILVRHGEGPHQTLKGMFKLLCSRNGGDCPLNHTGKAQAEKAEDLQNHLYELLKSSESNVEILCSPLARPLQTLYNVLFNVRLALDKEQIPGWSLEAKPRKLVTVKIHPGLRERHCEQKASRLPKLKPEGTGEENVSILREEHRKAFGARITFTEPGPNRLVFDNWLEFDYTEMLNAFNDKSLKVGGSVFVKSAPYNPELVNKIVPVVKTHVTEYLDGEKTQSKNKIHAYRDGNIRVRVQTHKIKNGEIQEVDLLESHVTPLGWQDGWNNRPAGYRVKESVTMFQYNVQLFIDYLRSLPDDKIVVAFCHGGTIRNTLAILGCKTNADRKHNTTAGETIHDDSNQTGIANVETIGVTLNRKGGKLFHVVKPDERKRFEYWRMFDGFKGDKVKRHSFPGDGIRPQPMLTGSRRRLTESQRKNRGQPVRKRRRLIERANPRF